MLGEEYWELALGLVVDLEGLVADLNSVEFWMVLRCHAGASSQLLLAKRSVFKLAVRIIVQKPN